MNKIYKINNKNTKVKKSKILQFYKIAKNENSKLQNLQNLTCSDVYSMKIHIKCYNSYVSQGLGIFCHRLQQNVHGQKCQFIHNHLTTVIQSYENFSSSKPT